MEKTTLKIVFKHKIDKPCSVHLIFPTGQDATNHLNDFVSRFGNENYTASFNAKEKMKLTLFPSIGGNGVWFTDLIYSKEEFESFKNSFLNKEMFLLMFGFMDEGKIINKSLAQSNTAWLYVRGYTLD